MKTQIFKQWIVAVSLILLAIACSKDEEPVIPPAPLAVANFTSAVDGTNSLKVNFTNTSEDAVSSDWDFGDGTTSSVASPSHIYEVGGTYTVKLTAKGAGGDTNEKTADVVVTFTLPVGSINVVNMTFESVEPVFNPFGGSTTAFITNPDKTAPNTSDKVLETVHGDQTWAGFYTDLDGKLNFVEKHTLKIKVWAPAAGNIRLKLETIAGGTFVEIDAPVTPANTWVQVSFDLSSQTDDYYDRITLFPGWDVSNAGTFYVDDIILE